MRARELLKKKRDELNQFQSRIVISIELPSPVKRFYDFYLATMKFLTGEEKTTWEEFITGNKISILALKLKYMFCVLLYTITIILAFQFPKILPLFWTLSYSFLHYCRYEVFSYTNPRGTFFLIDYCYYAALMMMILFNVPGLDKNPGFYATVFALQTGASLNSVLGMPGVNSLTFGSMSSISHMQLVYLHYVPSFVLFIDLLRKRREEPWVFNEVTSRHGSGQTVLMKHFVFPAVATTIWATVYIFLTEVVYYQKIYQSNPPYYTQTNYNLGYFRPRRAKAAQRMMEKFLKNIYLLRRDARFKPERNYAHHVTAIALYNIAMFFIAVSLLPLSFVFLKNIELFGIYLLALYLVIVYNGSTKMIREVGRIQRNSTLALKTRKKSEALSEVTTDTEDLNEGGSFDDEHWAKAYDDKTVLRKEDSKFKLNEKGKEKENNSSGDNDSHKTSLDDPESVPKPIPLNSQSKAVDKDL